jgi:hypothetical protein
MEKQTETETFIFSDERRLLVSEREDAIRCHLAGVLAGMKGYGQALRRISVAYEAETGM